jgi:type II secretory pathway pseudopilin PulG
MKTSAHNERHLRAFTLLEMSIVLLVLLALVRVGLFTYKKMDDWKLGRTASETLRTVYYAQRQYLSDNPTVSLTAITSADLLPYMPTTATSLPTIKSLTGTNLTININVSPPVINNSPSGIYDPSGSSTDSIWDVGE